MNNAAVAGNFKAHCPRCFRREWIPTSTPDIVQCGYCHYLFALRGSPVVSQPEPPASASDFYYSFTDVQAHAKRQRVRQLVYVMLDKYSFQSCTAAEAVKIANDLDDEIERIGAPKNA